MKELEEEFEHASKEFLDLLLTDCQSNTEKNNRRYIIQHLVPVLVPGEILEFLFSFDSYKLSSFNKSITSNSRATESQGN